VEREHGRFVLLEPDFSDDPFHKVREDITCTLSVQAEQNDFNLRVGIEPLATSFQDKVVYSESCLAGQRIYLERRSPRPTDSGWFIGRNGPEDPSEKRDRLAACYAYELLTLRPEVMKVLQLPAGHLVVFDGPDIRAVLTPEDETVLPKDDI
jgi:hypothetical protein